MPPGICVSQRVKSQEKIQTDVLQDVVLNDTVPTVPQDTVPLPDVNVNPTVPDVTPSTSSVSEQSVAPIAENNVSSPAVPTSVKTYPTRLRKPPSYLKDYVQ